MPQPLLDPASLGSPRVSAWYLQDWRIFLNFILMSLFFGINHGTVTALLALAPTELGNDLSGNQSGVLYVTYTVSALLVSGPFVQYFGGKLALSIGLVLNCAYTVSFLIATLDGPIRTPAALIGSGIGGIGAGWIWTAQGAIFANSARLYANAKGQEVGAATGYFGGIFATFYVGFETLLKAASSGIQTWGGKTAFFTVYTILAFVSALGVFLFVKDPPNLYVEEEEDLIEAQPEENSQSTIRKVFRKAFLAADLVARDTRMLLLYPLNMSFGFVVGFMNQYVNGNPLKHAIGSKNIGYMAAVTPGIAAILSMPYSWISSRYGKLPLMLFGAINFAAASFAVLALTHQQLVDLGWGLIFLYIINGSGRSVFESTNKATVADFFPEDKEAAFANVLIASGSSTAIAFFLFPKLDKLAISLIAGVTSVFAALCLVIAFSIHKRKSPL